MTDYLPKREADLDSWARLFDLKITAAPLSFGLLAAQATAFTALYGAWHAAYLVIKDNTTRTPAAIQTKNTAKDAMIDGPAGIRQLVRIIQAYPALTDTQRVDLGITVPDSQPTPVPPPAFPPQIDVISSVVRTVTIRLHNETATGGRAKPEGAMGAAIFSYVGELPPPLDQVEMWKFEMNIGSTTAEIEFPSTVAPGSTVWITATWYNRRGEQSPAATAVNVNLPGTLQQAA